MILNRRKLLADRDQLGRWGQKRCERFLKNKGLRTLTRNFSCKTGELDLVMVDTDGMLVFVEVKTRAGEAFVPAEASITSAKKRRMARAAKYFQAVHKIDDRPCRFDVVAIILGPAGPPEIRHYEAAFTP
jgi:putative endonuclease